MIVLANVYVDIYRSSYSTSSGTDTAQPYLVKVEGHISRIQGAILKPVQAGGVLYSQYALGLDTSVDVQKGDIIKNIRRKDSGKLWFDNTDYQEWRVTDANNSSIGFLEYRDVELTRIVAGGGFKSGI